VIRQAISCDICATEKRQTNHWFVAYEQGDELRISGWNSRHRLRPGSKHLCGQTCLHKLVDEFVAKSISVRAQCTTGGSEADPEPLLAPGRSLAHAAASADSESSARLIAPPEPALPRLASRPLPEVVTMPSRPHLEDLAPVPAEAPRYASRNWRAEAWERERERELRAVENRPDIAARRRSNA
jgi:hypothetical protein